MRDFRELKVWLKAHELTLAVYRATVRFPKYELYGLTGQIRQSCESIPANIAESCGRATNADIARFLQFAIGSACELEYHLLLARDLGMLPVASHDSLLAELIEVKRMLTTYCQRVRAGKPKPADH